MALNFDLNGLVEAGLGGAAVPAMAMPGADHPLLVSVPLVSPVVSRKVGLIRRKGRALSPEAQQLYDFLSEMKGKPVVGQQQNRNLVTVQSSVLQRPTTAAKKPTP